MKRNRERMKTFLEIKKKELSGILEDEVEYELKNWMLMKYAGSRGGQNVMFSTF